MCQIARRYPVPAAPTRREQVIQRSRFVASVALADSVDMARRFIVSIRSEYPDASHNCFAFLVGEPGANAHTGLSDDGEPSGTAGHPMMNALLTSGVGDIVAVVTRYYGGTKLGRGGLSRAYGSTLRLALSDLALVEKREWLAMCVHADYEHIMAVEKCLTLHEAAVLDRCFSAYVIWQVRVPAEQHSTLRTALGDATSGRAQLMDGQRPDP